MNGEDIAKKFHDAYESLAPMHGYKTRDASAVPWDKVPDRNKNLMIATANAVIDELYSEGWRIVRLTDYFGSDKVVGEIERISNKYNKDLYYEIKYARIIKKFKVET